MGTPSNLSQQVLAVPEGPASVRGAGESVETDPYSGTAQLRVPIFAPPGHAGLAPSLSLIYATHGGDGIAGVGFSLDLAQVKRRTDRGIPNYDASDSFVLQGDELLAVGGEHYRLRIENRFARIRHLRQQGRDYWSVEERDGSRVLYGVEPDHRLHDGEGRIAAWSPSQQRDAHGNTIHFHYRRDSSSREVLLVKVEWAGCFQLLFDYEPRPDPVRSARAGFLNTQTRRLLSITTQVRRHSDAEWTSFRRQELRYQSSTLTGRSLLSEVASYGIAADGSESALPTLSLSWSQPDLANARWHKVTGALPRRTLADPDLTLVRQAGSGLPDLLETGQAGHFLRENLGRGAFGPARPVPAPALTRLSHRGTFISDVDGDGWGDLVTGNGSHVYAGRPGGGWSWPRRSEAWPAVDLESPQTRVIDLDGDGRPDVLHAAHGTWTSFRSLPDGRWERGAELDQMPPVRLGDPRVHLADVSGDGLVDLVYVGEAHLLVWPGLGGGRFGAPSVLGDLSRLPRHFDRERVRFDDLTGSGRADLIAISEGTVAVCFNLGAVSLSAPHIVAGPRPTSRGHVEAVDLLGTGASGLLHSDDLAASGWQFLELLVGGPPDLLTAVDNGIGLTTALEYGGSASHYLRDAAQNQPWRTALPFNRRVLEQVLSVDRVTSLTQGMRYRYHHGVYDGKEREFRGFGRVDVEEKEAPPGDPQPLAPTLTRRFHHTGTPLDLRREQAPLPLPPLSDEVPEDPDARRALRGKLYRRELFALDGRPEPYLIEQNSFVVLPVASATSGRRWSYVPLPTLHRTAHSERGPELRVSQTVARYDLQAGGGYGLVIEWREIGHPRRLDSPSRVAQLSGDVLAQQAGRLERVRRTVYVQRQEPDVDPLDASLLPAYLVDRPSQVERYAVTRDGEELLARELLFYDGDPFSGSGHPETSSAAAVTRGRLSCRLQLAWTSALLSELAGPYPGAGAALAERGGYLELDGDLYIQAERWSFDARGTPLTSRDPRGHDSRVRYESRYHLFPILVLDRAGLPTRIERHELPFQIAALVDPNGNRTQLSYDARGQLSARSVMGKQGDSAWQGDPPSHPTESFEIDLTSLPVRVTTHTRQERLGAFSTVHRYLDGRGRPLQERHQAEPDPDSGASRYRVTGWQVRNHKGLVVVSHPPFFAATGHYATGRIDTAPVRTSYDALGRVVRVHYPDGTFASTGHQPWMRIRWDRNDNAAHLDAADARYGAHLDAIRPHFDTPTRLHGDAWDRQIGVEIDRGSEVHLTRTEFDLTDRRAATFDARGGASAMWSFRHDLAGCLVARRHRGGLGWRLALHDAAGNEIWSRNSRDIEVERTFDPLDRQLSEESERSGDKKLRRLFIYGSDSGDAASRAANRVGRLEEARDASGLRLFSYDFRGLATKVEHRFFAWVDGEGRPLDDPNCAIWREAKDWDPPIPGGERDVLTAWLAGDAAGTTVLELGTDYDAAKRPTELRFPADLAQRIAYYPSGLVAGYGVYDGSTWRSIAEEMRYDARGRLTSMRFGNGVEAGIEYDEATQRPLRFLVRAGAAVLMDRRYAYDPAGNPLRIEDALEERGDRGQGVVPNTRTFRYDAGYRLIRATGQRHKSARRPDQEVLVPAPAAADYEPYNVAYAYDAVGNFLLNEEVAPTAWRYREDLPDLLEGIDGLAGSYDYDGAGNTIATPLLALAYSHDNQARYLELASKNLQVIDRRHGDRRSLKVARSDAGVTSTLYLGAFELRRSGQGVDAVLRVAGHAEVERRLEGGAGPNPAARLFFVHPDHLGSASLLTGADGELLNQEEYFPYGRASDRRGEHNRYRFLGAERDIDTGLSMTGPRLYDPALGRFLQGDPLATDRPGWGPHVYSRAAPLARRDPSGYQDEAWLEDSTWTYIEGGAQIFFGGTEVVIGVAGIFTPEPGTTIAGVALTLHGLDTLTAGIVTLQSGQAANTVTHTVSAGGARALGFSEQSAEYIGFGTDLALGFTSGIGVMRGLSRAALVTGPQSVGWIKYPGYWLAAGGQSDANWMWKLSLKNKAYYEAGSTTVPKATWEYIKGMSVVDRGKYMVEMHGWVGAFFSTSWGQVATVTLHTGATPLGRVAAGFVWGAGAVPTFYGPQVLAPPPRPSTPLLLPDPAVDPTVTPPGPTSIQPSRSGDTE
ncbi:MAG: SpvB/TcaC N-terminal domain-containing protein [Acidobacteriota bacterium]